jgi:hypothetical protein
MAGLLAVGLTAIVLSTVVLLRSNAIRQPPIGHEVIGRATDVTPQTDVTSDAHLRNLRGGWTYIANGRTYRVRATCLQIARDRLLGSPARQLPDVKLVKPYVDAIVTGITSAHAPGEHTVLEVLDDDGSGRLWGRQSWQFGNGVVMHPGSSPRCWLPYLLPVPADPDRAEAR